MRYDARAIPTDQLYPSRRDGRMNRGMVRLVEEDELTVAKGKVVGVEYVLTDPSGGELERSTAEEPLVYLDRGAERCARVGRRAPRLRDRRVTAPRGSTRERVRTQATDQSAARSAVRLSGRRGGRARRALHDAGRRGSAVPDLGDQGARPSSARERATPVGGSYAHLRCDRALDSRRDARRGSRTDTRTVLAVTTTTKEE